MPQATKYDVIVIGTSQGGRFLPITFAKAGRKVALVERGLNPLFMTLDS
jgi:pyruvate/2-oxoglutarate dehydrogenase complex dihydrolipoamide dehydrogenase (E3) component